MRPIHLQIFYQPLKTSNFDYLIVVLGSLVFFFLKEIKLVRQQLLNFEKASIGEVY